MARRLRKAEANAIGLLIIVAIPIYVAAKIFESVGWVIPVVAVITAIALYGWYRQRQKTKRLEYLRGKYHDEELVQKIFNGYFWQGQTAEQLEDSLGRPVAVDDKRLKTKTKEIWKYQHQSANRYALRITVENGVVIGWDQKA
jgi:hypothetical protein